MALHPTSSFLISMILVLSFYKRTSFNCDRAWKVSLSKVFIQSLQDHKFITHMGRWHSKVNHKAVQAELFGCHLDGLFNNFAKLGLPETEFQNYKLFVSEKTTGNTKKLNWHGTLIYSAKYTPI